MARTPLPPILLCTMQNLSPCFCFQIADDYFLAPDREKKGTGPLLRPSLPQVGSCSNPKERAEVSGSPFAGLLSEMESVTYIPITSSGKDPTQAWVLDSVPGDPGLLCCIRNLMTPFWRVCAEEPMTRLWRRGMRASQEPKFLEDRNSFLHLRLRREGVFLPPGEKLSEFSQGKRVFHIAGITPEP